MSNPFEIPVGDEQESDTALDAQVLGAVKKRLEEGGYSGLYQPEAPCGCRLGDLAPCGDCRADKAGWINDCVPGYTHDDPRQAPEFIGRWIITPRATAPTQADFDYAYACGG
jgi:hypothetical protein